MDHGQKAKELFLSGYNCTQAVVGAFAEDDWFKETGLNFDTAIRLASSFGGGMGRLREVCGTVSGMFFIAGLRFGYTPEEDALSLSENPKNSKKALHYARIQKLAKEFTDANGSIVCRELLGLKDKTTESPIPEPRTPEYYKKRPCADLAACAANIIEKFIEEENNL